MLAAYNGWLEEPTRTLVLDKKRQAKVANVKDKSHTQLRKTCLMLVVHPALDPSDLWIQAGDGKKWNLQLLSGDALPPADLPPAVDHFPGFLVAGVGGFDELALYNIYIYIYLVFICFEYSVACHHGCSHILSALT